MAHVKEPLIIVHVMLNYDEQRGGVFNVVKNLLAHTPPKVRQYVLSNKGPKSLGESFVLHTPEQLEKIRPHIIHFHGMSGFHGRVLRYIDKQHNHACLIHSPHGYWHPFTQKGRPIYKRLLARILYDRILFKHCAHYYVLTEREINDLRRKGAKGKFEIVQNGLDSELLMLSTECYGEKVRSPHVKENTLLFIGGISPGKGILELIAAFKKVAPENWSLCIHGPTTKRFENYQAELKKLIQEDSRITLDAPIYGQEKYMAMLRAKVFCLPSFAEGMALAPLEAATLGCKLLVSDACGYQTLPQGTVFHTYDQNQKAALERTMEKMFTQPDSFFEPDLETIRQMQKSFEWGAIINHYFKLYESATQ